MTSAPGRPSSSALTIVVVGLGFGRDFLPLYLRHPDVGRVGICDADAERMAEIGDAHGVGLRYDRLEDVLADDAVDAVHLLTPVPFHARQVLACLAAGKHVACAVPMATSVADAEAIAAAERETGLVYMMMETAVYGREYLYARELAERGDLGSLTFLRGYHLQDLEGFPTYWWGFPPMHYVTHALSPLLALADASATSVRCLGSGRVPEADRRDYDNPWATETAIFRLDRDDLAAEVTMGFHRVGRAYQEGFSVYGAAGGFEWEQLDGEGPVRFTMQPPPAGGRGRPAVAERVEVPDHAHLLPAPLRPFTRRTSWDPGTGRAVEVGAGHGGSHPHLVHEFVSAVTEGRAAAVDAATAARFTVPGICAHTSAMSDGAVVEIPALGRS
jgi:predicted dehydrogenase